MQSRKMSVVETLANYTVGIPIAVAITHYLLPVFGYQASLDRDIFVTSVYTLASVIRSFGVRRFFNWIWHRSQKSKITLPLSLVERLIRKLLSQEGSIPLAYELCREAILQKIPLEICPSGTKTERFSSTKINSSVEPRHER